MTDLEMTKKCAEKVFSALEWEQRLFDYDPLHDDAQAMALVKRFGLGIYYDLSEWGCYKWASDKGPTPEVMSANLNRAIVECVARMP